MQFEVRDSSKSVGYSSFSSVIESAGVYPVQLELSDEQLELCNYFSRISLNSFTQFKQQRRLGSLNSVAVT